MAECRFLGRQVHVEHGQKRRGGRTDIGAHDDRHGVLQAQHTLLGEDDGEAGGDRAGLHHGGEQEADEDAQKYVLWLHQVFDHLGHLLDRLQCRGYEVQAEEHEAEIEH